MDNLTLILPKLDLTKVTEETEDLHALLTKREEILRQIRSVVAKYPEAVLHVVETDNTGSVGKYGSLVSLGWFLHSPKMNINSNYLLKKFLDEHMTYLIPAHSQSLYWLFHSLTKNTNILNIFSIKLV